MDPKDAFHVLGIVMFFANLYLGYLILQQNYNLLHPTAQTYVMAVSMLAIDVFTVFVVRVIVRAFK